MIIIERPVCVITPTIGKDTLAKAIESVSNQSYGSITHLIVNDGKPGQVNVDKTNPKIQYCELPWNVGGNGFYDHRIYAAFPHLIDSDYILFLDEDNWYEPDHVKSLVNTIESQNLDFTYSLRNIMSPDGDFLLEDDCESLGQWPIWINPNEYHVDTSSYCFRKNMIVSCAHLWQFGWGADRRFYNTVKTKFNHANSKQRTLNYRLAGNTNSVNDAFFFEGNRKLFEKYQGQLPWKN